MTVAELIDHLRQFPPETKVVLDGADVTEPCEFISLSSLAFK